ncbi:MAG TPA: site-specific integrase [Dehalococcoidia bacterium]|nr:site-specific integrase [Dehalococcoidia bacterium]
MAWGDGSLYRRRDGRWCGQLSVGGRRLYVYGRTRREAMERLAALRERARQGLLPPQGSRTVGDLLRAVLASQGQRWSERTRHDYGLLAGHLLRHLERARLSSLSPERLEAVLAALSGELGAKAVWDCYRLLRRALNLAVRWGWLPDSPLKRVEPPRLERRERRLWTAGEARLFLREARGSPYWPWWALSLACGLRPGEAAALRWRDVDWERGLLSVSRSVQRVGGRWAERATTKTGRGRSVPLSALAMEALRRQRELLMARGLPVVGDALVFPAQRGGGYQDRTVVGHALHREARRLGLAPIRLHDLRHLSASIALEMGAPVTLTARFLGHATPATTTGTYAHALGDAGLVATLLDQALSG